MSNRFKVAAVQATPAFLDREASIDKAISLMREAARQGAQLVVFPEAFIPAYPLWVWFIPAGETHPLRELYSILHANSIAIPGPEVSRLAEAAGDFGVDAVIGVNEVNAESSGSSLFNSMVYLSADGRVLGKHRKLIPTAGERLIWAQAASSDLDVYDLGFAKVSGLICWENYMPLARHTLTAKGQQIHCAPTWDRGEPWISSMRHIAKEGRCVVVSPCQYFTKSDIPDHLTFKSKYLSKIEGVINPGKSVIVDPDGKLVAGPAEDGEEILYAEFLPDQLIGPRWQLDTAGHYSRPDVFKLKVVRAPRPQLTESKGKD
jgi:nitrilase